MRRALPLLVVVAIAAVLAWIVAQGGDPTGEGACAEVERRIKAGDLPGAEAVARSARERVPPYVARYLDALVAMASGKDDAAALAAAEDAYALSPAARDDWRVVSVLFYARINGGRREPAWQALETYLTAHPSDERALASAAQYWVEAVPDRPDPERAREYLDRLEALPARTVPDGDPTAVTPDQVARLRGRVEGLRGRLETAVSEAEKVVAARPRDADARVRLGEALRHARRLEAARQAFREAAALDPGNLAVRKQLALLLCETDDTGAELESLTSAMLAAAPSDPEVRMLRARALVRVEGRIDDAIALYRDLRKEDLPVALRREVARNLAVALYDWKQGGRPGDYLDESRALLVEYRQLGGELDLRTADLWDNLERLAGGSGTDR